MNEINMKLLETHLDLNSYAKVASMKPLAHAYIHTPYFSFDSPIQ
jgi:hypothetical protein